MANPHFHSLELNSILEDDNPPQPPLSRVRERLPQRSSIKDGIVSLDLNHTVNTWGVSVSVTFMSE